MIVRRMARAPRKMKGEIPSRRTPGRHDSLRHCLVLDTDHGSRIINALPGEGRKECNMANVGDKVMTGEQAPETGRYRHDACGDTIILNKRNKVPPCSKCGKGGSWTLITILT